MFVYVFEYINKSPEDDNSVLVLNGDLSCVNVGSTLSGYCSEDGKSHELTAVCLNTLTGEWIVQWANYPEDDSLMGLNGSIGIGDLITRVSGECGSEWDYCLKQIG